MSFLPAPSLHLLPRGLRSGVPSHVGPCASFPWGVPAKRSSLSLSCLEASGTPLCPSRRPAVFPPLPRLPLPHPTACLPQPSRWPNQLSLVLSNTATPQCYPYLLKVYPSFKACLLQEAFVYHHLSRTPVQATITSCFLIQWFLEGPASSLWPASHQASTEGPGPAVPGAGTQGRLHGRLLARTGPELPLHTVCCRSGSTCLFQDYAFSVCDFLACRNLLNYRVHTNDHT